MVDGRDSGTHANGVREFMPGRNGLGLSLVKSMHRVSIIWFTRCRMPAAAGILFPLYAQRTFCSPLVGISCKWELIRKGSTSLPNKAWDSSPQSEANVIATLQRVLTDSPGRYSTTQVASTGRSDPEETFSLPRAHTSTETSSRDGLSCGEGTG